MSVYICGVCMCVCVYLYVVCVCRWVSCSVNAYVCLCAYLGCREIVYRGKMSSIVCVLILQYVFLRVVCVSDRWVLCGNVLMYLWICGICVFSLACVSMSVG